MTAINFSPVFAADVRSGKKRCTIRGTRRSKKGGRLQFYTGMQTTKCRKLSEGICTAVTRVAIHEKHLMLGTRKISAPKSLAAFAQKDGHKSWSSLTGWFEKRYGLPYKGWLHEWELV